MAVSKLFRSAWTHQNFTLISTRSLLRVLCNMQSPPKEVFSATLSAQLGQPFFVPPSASKHTTGNEPLSGLPLKKIAAILRTAKSTGLDPPREKGEDYKFLFSQNLKNKFSIENDTISNLQESNNVDKHYEAHKPGEISARPQWNSRSKMTPAQRLNNLSDVLTVKPICARSRKQLEVCHERAPRVQLTITRNRTYR